MDGHRVEPGGHAADRPFLVRNRPDESRARVPRLERRPVDRRRQRRSGALFALPRHLRSRLHPRDRTGQHPCELRVWRERFAVDGQEQEHPSTRGRQGSELHQDRARCERRGWITRRQGQPPCLPGGVCAGRRSRAARAHVRDPRLDRQQGQRERRARHRPPQRVRPGVAVGRRQYGFRPDPLLSLPQAEDEAGRHRIP